MDFLPKVTKEINNNKNRFLKIEKRIKKENRLSKKIKESYNLSVFATENVTDIFSSETIESSFLDLAKLIHPVLSKTYQKKSILHVLTCAYKIGGHTRCVERWIENIPEFIHSCILLNQRADVPDTLSELTKKSGGQFLLLDKKLNLVEKSEELRKFASNYEYIILHTHMYDPIPLVAFGTEEFMRPVFLFNHADHIFWLGNSIADHVFDISTYGHLITKNLRGNNRSSILGIPQSIEIKTSLSKFEARKKLNLDPNEKIIFSAGSANKYSPIYFPSFTEIIANILSENNKLHFYIAGPTLLDEGWKQLVNEYKSNVHLLGYLDSKTVYPLYLQSCDLVLDSYPIGGSTSAMDAIQYKKVVLSLNKNLQNDFVTESLGFCSSVKDLKDKITNVLDDAVLYKSILQNQEKLLDDEMNLQMWKKRFLSTIEKFDKHNLYHVQRVVSDDINDVSLISFKWIQGNLQDSFIGHIKEYLHALFKIRLRKGKKIVRLFGVTFVDINLDSYIGNL